MKMSMYVKFLSFCLFMIVFVSHSLGASDFSNVVFMTGSGNPELAKNICDTLKVPLLDAGLSHFKNGEIHLTLSQKVREKDVLMIAAFNENNEQSVNDQCMELFLMADVCRRSGANRLYGLLLNYPYARQDRRSDKRSPISASLMANILEKVCRFHRIFTVDLHSPQTQGFFQNIGVDNITTSKLFASHIARLNLHNIVVVSPDAGGARRTEQFQEYLKSQGITADFAMMIKKRRRPNEVESSHLVGDVKEKTAIIIDDMCDTGGTLVAAAKELKKMGAKEVYACISHPVFSGNAVEKISASDFVKVFVTDSLPLKQESEKIQVLSLKETLAEVIRRVLHGESLGEAFPS